MSETAKQGGGKHASHETRFSDASSYDEVCVNCGATDISGGGWGKLAHPCSAAPRQRDQQPLTPPESQ